LQKPSDDLCCFQSQGDAKELSSLVTKVRPFLKSISKAKAAKLIRTLVDLFLDMETSSGLEVIYCDSYNTCGKSWNII